LFGGRPYRFLFIEPFKDEICNGRTDDSTISVDYKLSRYTKMAMAHINHMMPTNRK
jgi:hypothetical protein